MSFKHSRNSRRQANRRTRSPNFRRVKAPRSLRLELPLNHEEPRVKHNRRLRADQRTAQRDQVELLPLVTVVMAIRNEEKFIERSLSAVLEQDYPTARYEVIVADGQSTDSTPEILRNLQTKYPFLTVVSNPGKIVSPGLNAAIRAARGEYIVRVDGHTIIERDYVRRCVEKLQTTGADNVGGKMNAISEGEFGQCVALATSSRFGVGGALFHYCDEERWVDTVYLGAWRRDLFARIGLFDEEQVRNQDDEFNYRLQEQDGRVLLSPAIKSIYYNRATPKKLFRQYFEYGYWKVRVMQKHPTQMRSRQFAPPAFVGALLVTACLALFTTFGGWLLAGLSALYLAANFAAAFLTAKKSSYRYLPGLMLSFGCLHIGYGAGFLLGLARFGNRWSDKGQLDYLALDGQPLQPAVVPAARRLSPAVATA